MLKITEKSEKPFKNINLTRFQIKVFLFRLAGPEGCRYGYKDYRCGGNEYTYARKILDLVHISEAEQRKFLKAFQELGGFCDCEILMNAAGRLLGEDTPW